MSIRPERLTQPHVVYRCYSYDGALLYVGCTYNLDRRLKEHRAEQGPWGFINHTTLVTVESAPDRATALDVEREAIRNEKPIFNDQGTGRWSVSRTGWNVQPHLPAYVPRHVA